MPLAAAQDIFFQDLPPVVRQNLRADQLATDITVYPDEGTDVEALAARIEADIPNASAMTGTEFDGVVGSSVAIFNAIIVGVALISLIVGGLSVINTMAMTVAERTREIGIKRAIGGSRARVIRELVSEAGLIGLLGGLLGLGLGAVVVVPRQRGRPELGDDPLPAHPADGDLRRPLLDHPRRRRRDHPRLERGAPRPGRGPPLRIGATGPWHFSKGATCARPTSSAAGTRSRRCAGSTVSIEAGELVAIMGPSGSGKSTLMHLLGLLHSPDQNHGPAPELSFGGRDATRMSDGERTRIRAREMGFVFQQFNLVPTLTAVENVMLAGEYAGLGRREARERAIARLNMVGLAERATHRPSELSGGEQQRVAIARALVNDPALVLADEPTGNLDSHRSAELLGLIRKLNREHGQTFVLVTHDAEVGAACDRIIRMRDGLVQAVELVNDPTPGDVGEAAA